jgi:hypothetical protein
MLVRKCSRTHHVIGAPNRLTLRHMYSGGQAISNTDLQRALMVRRSALRSHVGPLSLVLQGAVAGMSTRLSLSHVLESEEVSRTGLLDNPTVLEELMQLLPEGQRDPSNLRETVAEHLSCWWCMRLIMTCYCLQLQSPQFRQALGALTAALHTDNFNAIMANLGLDPSRGMDALVRGDRKCRCRALIRANSRAYRCAGIFTSTHGKCGK